MALLGYKGALLWVQDETGLRVQFPDVAPSDPVVALRITGVTGP